jgi:putative transposase
VTTGERRAVVTTVRGRYDVSERQACRMLGFERSVVRFVPQRPVIDAPLREKLCVLAAQHPRWGVPRLHWRLQRDGWLVNYKRVERLYRLEGLAVRRRKRKRLAVPRVPRPIAVGPNETWSLDFVSDQLSSGRRFRTLTLIDSCTRECLAISVAYSLPSTAVIAALESVIAQRGQPVRLSLDNGSEFRSRIFDAWAADRGITLQFIQPGKPVQNAHVESFNGKFRDECLNQHWFLSLLDAQFHIERYRRAFNAERPHEACFPLTPNEYALTFTSTPAQLSA